MILDRERLLLDKFCFSALDPLASYLVRLYQTLVTNSSMASTISVSRRGSRALVRCEKGRHLSLESGRIENHHAFAQDASFDRSRVPAPVMDHDAAIGV